MLLCDGCNKGTHMRCVAADLRSFGFVPNLHLLTSVCRYVYLHAGSLSVGTCLFAKLLVLLPQVHEAAPRGGAGGHLALC
jgi:hypothetical protein